MTALFHDGDASIMAGVLVLLMIASWAIGRRAGLRARRLGRSPEMGKSGDAVLAVMGLLLGFSFAMALQKHEQRRITVVNDSNAIGDFYTCAAMLKDPIRTQLQQVLR